LLRLQRIVIGDARFLRLGFRMEDGFVGEHDRDGQMPLPHHIDARPEDLPSLIDGMIAFDRGAGQSIDAVIAAAVLTFGFVYTHPFEDGNGRIHRYLIHHILAERGFNPPGMVLPVSAAILERIDDYRRVLESCSRGLLPLIKWEATPTFNVRVLNDTGDLYRYFDATQHAAFLYGCVQKIHEEHLPAEAQFLQRYDEFRRQVETFLEMPDASGRLAVQDTAPEQGPVVAACPPPAVQGADEDEDERIEAIYCAVFEAMGA
jgi:hypothetical protein